MRQVPNSAVQRCPGGLGLVGSVGFQSGGFRFGMGSVGVGYWPNTIGLGSVFLCV